MVMLAVTLGAIVMSGLALSSFLNVIDLRGVTDTRLSQAAIFSADTGIECALLIEFNNVPTNNRCPAGVPAIDIKTFDSDGRQIGKFSLDREVIGNITTYTSVGSDPNGRAIRNLKITLTKQ